MRKRNGRQSGLNTPSKGVSLIRAFGKAGSHVTFGIRIATANTGSDLSHSKVLTIARSVSTRAGLLSTVNGMQFLAEWLETGVNKAAEEAATVARLRIIISNQSATDMRLNEQSTIVHHVVVPAYPLAEAIAYRWWTLAHGRGRTFRLRTMRAGFALPDISITAIGDGSMDVRCEPFVYDNPPVEFVTKASEWIPVSTFEGDLKRFIDGVLERLRNQSVGETPLSARWLAVTASMNDSEERAFCQAAGSLGVDPYTSGNEVAEFIEAASSMFEYDDLEEFLAAGVRPEIGMKAINWLKNAERQLNGWSVLPAIDDCRRKLAFRRTPSPPWRTGYSSARIVRQYLGLSESEPVPELSKLATVLGNPQFRATSESTVGLRGISRIQPGRPPEAIVGDRPDPRNLLFTVARTFGDALHFGGAGRSPVTDRRGTYRQRLGRAFAAEFLAPKAEVMGMHSEGKQIEDIATNFGVSDMVIDHQIENSENALAG